MPALQGQVVKLNPGTFNISYMIRIKSGVTFRGSGITSTIIKGMYPFTGGWWGMIGIEDSNWNYDWNVYSAKNLTAAGLVKGSSTVNTSSAHGWSVGDVIYIDQLYDGSADPPITNGGLEGCNYCGRGSEGGNRPIGQWAEVKAVPTATSATIDPPLFWNSNITKSPQAMKAAGITKDAGIEDMTLDNSLSNLSNPYHMTWAVNSWFLNVKMKGPSQHMIYARGGLRNTIKGCTIDGNNTVYLNDYAYGIYALESGTAWLIEDNIWHNLVLPISFEGAWSGNVISYNYFSNLHYYDDTWGRQSIGFHANYPIMNLIEGNYNDGGKLSADNYHGGSSYQTYLRNRMIQNQEKYYGNWGFDIYEYNQYMNMIGNVLGTAGYETTYQMDGSQNYGYENVATIYRLGYEGASSNDLSNFKDPQVKATILRHGNWDSVTNGTVWDPNISDHTLPVSLYLSFEPSWFGNLAWPPIGPDLSPMAGSIPAKARYEGQSYPYGGGDTTRPSAPTGLIIK